METVEVMIKVPKDLYEGIECRNGELETEYVCDELMKAVDNGTVLPKGHTDLIDRQALIHSIEQKAKRLSNLDTINGLCGAVAIVFDALTIVEADNAESNDKEGSK